MPQYQGVWNLAQQAQALTQQQWVTDPLFDYTTLLLQGDAGANGAQNNTFYDTSPNQFAITRNGGNPGMTQGSFSPFSLQPGEWGNYFNGTTTSGPLLYTAYSTTNFDWFTSGQDFTLECWVFPVDLATFSYLDGGQQVPRLTGNNDQNGFDNYWSFGPISDGTVRLHYFNGAVVRVTSTATVRANTWNHVAFTKTSSGITIFVNGVASTTTAISGTPQSSATYPLTIGRGNSASINGYVSNYRILKNVTPPYSGAYTVPTVPLANISGTKILTAQANRFVDASSVANTMIVTGSTVSVQAFSPFAPQYQYTPTVTGGSGYFDGTGDYLYAGNNAAFTMGTGDFTYECWVYHTSITGQQTYFARTNGNFNGVYFYKDSSGFPGVYYTAQVATSSVAITANQWYHLVASRLSGTLRIFVNGVQTASVANTTNLTESVCYVGGDSNATNFMVGYMTGARILKGTGYSSITVPTAPVTAIANTSLLLNFTNAGILDGTMKNNLETVGNAQVSTNVVKYGSGSLYFDGTGDYLIAPAGPQFDFGTGDFTIEFWTYPLTSGATTSFYEQWVNAVGSYVTGQIELQKNTSNQLVLYVSTGASANAILTTSNTLAANTWTHIAITRSNGLVRAFFNGVQDPTTLTLTTQAGLSNRTPTIGVELRSASLYYNGYLDDFRITKGIARYTRNFTPPQVALPRQ